MQWRLPSGIAHAPALPMHCALRASLLRRLACAFVYVFLCIRQKPGRYLLVCLLMSPPGVCVLYAGKGWRPLAPLAVILPMPPHGRWASLASTLVCADGTSGFCVGRCKHAPSAAVSWLPLPAALPPHPLPAATLPDHVYPFHARLLSQPPKDPTTDTGNKTGHSPHSHQALAINREKDRGKGSSEAMGGSGESAAGGVAAEGGLLGQGAGVKDASALGGADGPSVFSKSRATSFKVVLRVCVCLKHCV